MALNLISLEEAAKLLGISTERVNLLRDRQQLHGYRDGASWKFKRQDVERLKAEGLGDGGGEGEESIEFLSLPLDIDDEDSQADAVLLSELELGESGPGTSSTVIGKPGQLSPAESDIRIVTDEDRRRGGAGGSDVKLVAGDKGTPGSDVKLVAEGSVTGSNAATGAGMSGIMDDLPLLDDDSELSIDLGNLSDLNLAESGITPGKPAATPAASSSLHLASDTSDGSSASGLVLGGTEGSAVTSGKDASAEKSAAGSDLVLGDDVDSAELNFDDILAGADASGLSLPTTKAPAATGRRDSEVDLDAGEDLVLSPERSDVTRRPADSGIALRSPSDSGLSLEEPVELSGVGEAPLELGEDPLLSLVDDADSSRLDNLQESDEEFLLTPMEEAREAEGEDSGSQVIALDSDSGFAQEGLLDVDEGFAGADVLGGAVAAGAGLPSSAPVGALSSRETPYSIWQVLSLGLGVVLLSLSGMMMYDLVRNMWSWRGPYAVTSPLMDFLAGLFG